LSRRNCSKKYVPDGVKKIKSKIEVAGMLTTTNRIETEELHEKKYGR